AASDSATSLDVGNVTFNHRAFVLQRLSHRSGETIAFPGSFSRKVSVKNRNYRLSVSDNEIGAGSLRVIGVRISLRTIVDVKASDVRRLVVSTLHHHCSGQSLNINPARYS